MKPKLKICATMLLLSALPSASMADSWLYSGLGYGSADFESMPQYDNSLAAGQKLQEKTGFTQVYVGYRLTKWLAFEVGYADAAQMSKNYSLNPSVPTFVAVNNREQVDLQKVALDAVLEFPLADRFSLIGSLGYTRVKLDRTITGGFAASSGGLRTSGSETENGLSYGAGLKYLFGESYAVRLQHVRYSLGNIDLNSTQLAVEMDFFQF